MPRRSPSREQVQWLIENHKTSTLVECSKHLGFCPDTLRRVLVREGVASYPGAKYTVSRKRLARHWNRPCMRCKCTKTRERNQYLCVKCTHLTSGEVEYG